MAGTMRLAGASSLSHCMLRMRSRRFLISLVLGLTGLGLRAQVPTAQSGIAAQAIAPGGTATLDLRNYFGLPGVSGQIVQFSTVLGKFNVELLSNAAPRNAANFLSYVQAGAYANSFIHRVDAVISGGPIAIVQGGGFTVPLTANGPGNVSPFPPVALEANLPNTRGTLAAARTSDPNSATSQFFFNTVDNSTTLSPANTGGGYSVFGRVIGSGMQVVDQIAAEPRVNAGGAFATLPVVNYVSGDVLASNLITMDSVKAISMYPGNG